VAEREASVKLTLDDSQYIVELRKAGDAAESSGKKGAKAMGLFGHGIKGATSELKSLAGTASKAMGLVTGLAGGFTVAGALKGAVELDSAFKRLAFRVSQATGEQVKATEIQRVAEQAAAKTGRRTAEMAEAYEQLFAATGDRDFADNMLETMGEAMQATGAEMGTLTTLADQLHTKFGVAAEEMGDVFAQVFEHAQKGGPAMSEFADVAATMGAELLQAGMGGRRGLDFMLGALVKTDDEFGNLGKQVKGIKQILMSLGDQNQIKGLAKTLGINPNVLLNEKDLMGRMRKVLGMGKKGLDALKGSMHEAEEQKALRILFTDPFEAALKDAEASGAKGKAAIDKALGVLDGGMAEFGKATLNGADLQKEAASRMSDPQARLTAALETLERSFASPEIIDAIEELSTYLPDIAKAFGGFAKFVAQNPLLAGAMGVGGSAAKGFLVSAGTELASAHWKGGLKAAASIEGAHVIGGMKAGNLIKGAGGLAALAIAGALAKEQIDKSFAANAEAQGSSAVALAKAGSNAGGIGAKRAQAEELRKAIDREKEAGSGISGFTQDLMGGIATVAGVGGPNLRAQNEARIQELQGLLAKKEREIESLAKGGNSTPVAPGADPKGKATVAVDAAAQRGVGKAVADAMRGQVQRVELVNPGGGMGGGGGIGGSRGPTRPPAPAPIGGF